MRAMLLKLPNSSFIKGLCVGLSLSLLFLIQQQYRWMSVEFYVESNSFRRDLHVFQGLSDLDYSLNDQDYTTIKRHKSLNTRHKPEENIGQQGHVSVAEGDLINPHSFNDTHQHHDDDSLAKEMYKNVRIACWILTSPKNIKTKAIHVKNTWAKRCHLFLFMSSVKDDNLPAVGLNVTEGRSHLTAKTMKAFKYLYDHHFDDADWFLKADDDTYVIMENLRYFLSNENPQEPIAFGQRFKPFVKQGYPSGGGGYVLSKESLRRYGTDGFYRRDKCVEDKGAEDINMGRCLQNLGVKLKPSLDALKRTRFHCFKPETFINGTLPKWYNKYNLEGIGGGIENMSDYAISFHYVSPRLMYALEYYTYHLHPYGITRRPQALNVVNS